MQVISASGKDSTGSTRSSDGSSGCGAFTTAGNRADGRSNTSATTDHGDVALLVILCDAHIGARFDLNRLSIVFDGSQRQAQRGLALDAARLLHVDDTAGNGGSFCQNGLPIYEDWIGEDRRKHGSRAAGI